MSDYEFLRLKWKIEHLRAEQRTAVDCGDWSKNALLGRMIGEYASDMLAFIRGDN